MRKRGKGKGEGGACTVESVTYATLCNSEVPTQQCRPGQGPGPVGSFPSGRLFTTLNLRPPSGHVLCYAGTRMLKHYRSASCHLRDCGFIRLRGTTSRSLCMFVKTLPEQWYELVRRQVIMKQIKCWHDNVTMVLGPHCYAYLSFHQGQEEMRDRQTEHSSEERNPRVTAMDSTSGLSCQGPGTPTISFSNHRK